MEDVSHIYTVDIWCFQCEGDESLQTSPPLLSHYDRLLFTFLLHSFCFICVFVTRVSLPFSSSLHHSARTELLSSLQLRFTD